MNFLMMLWKKKPELILKDKIMNTFKIAIPTNNKKDLSKHFGRSKFFAIYSIVENKVAEISYIPLPKHDEHDHQHNHANGSQSQPMGLGMIEKGNKGAGGGRDFHGDLIELIKDCNVLISGGMGMGMQENLKRTKFKTYLTKIKTIEEAVNSYIDGTLVNDNELLH